MNRIALPLLCLVTLLFASVTTADSARFRGGGSLAAAAPTAILAANPTSITTGQSSTLTWSSTGANTCSGTGFSTGGLTSGSTSVSPTTTTTYSVTCTGLGGSAGANATVTVSAPVTATGGCDALCILATSLSTQGKYKLLVAPTPAPVPGGVANFTAASLGYECGDPATNSSCWVNDFDGCQVVGQSCPTGPYTSPGTGWAAFFYGAYGTNRPLLDVDSFSASGISKDTGMVAWTGGGHSVNFGIGGEGSIFSFNALTAADNINKSVIPTCPAGVSSGPGDCWRNAVPGGRILPNNAGQPVWSQQNDPGCGATPWITYNKLGTGTSNQQSPAQHSYWGLQFKPGSTSVIIGGSNSGCVGSGQLTGNSGGKIVDVNSGAVTLLNGTPGTLRPGAYDPISGGYWSTLSGAGDTNHIYQYSLNPASYTRTQYGSSCAQTGDPTEGAVLVFPDPQAPSTDSDLIGLNMAGYNGTSGTGSIFLRQHINGVGGTPSDQCSTFLASPIPSNGGDPISTATVAYDNDDGTLLWPDNGGHVFRINLNFASLASSTISTAVANPTGDVPACLGNGTLTNLQYLPWARSGSGGVGLIEVTCNGLVRVAPLAKSCVYTGSTNPWSCIDPTSTNGITDGGGNGYNFNVGVNELRVGGAHFAWADQAVLCNNQNYTSIGYHTASPSPALWWNQTGFQQQTQTINGCNPQKYFHVTHSGVTTDYYQPDLAVVAAVSGDVITTDVNPSAIPYWNYPFDISTSGVTVNITAGTSWENGVSTNACSFAVSQVCVNANNVTINGADVYMMTSAGQSLNSTIDSLPHFKNLTIQGTAGHYFTLDGQQLTGQPGNGTGMHAVETSCDSGTLTLNHVKAINQGGGPSQSHAIYPTWGCAGVSPIPAASSYCANLNDVINLNNTGVTPANKMDQTCGDFQDAMINSAVLCNSFGLANHGCDFNEPIDFQCGGWHLVQNSLIEMNSYLAGEQWNFHKIAWSGDTTAGGGGYAQQGCPDSPPLVNNTRFDKNIFILDGTNHGNNGFGAHSTIICGSAFDGNDCNANAPAMFVTNSGTSITVGAYQDIQTLTVGTGLTQCTNPNGCGGQLAEIRSASSPNTIYETVAINSYNATTGQLVVTVEVPNGSGTLCSAGAHCTVSTRPYAPVCVTNSVIIEDTTNYPSFKLLMGTGTYTDSGCTTASGTDSNTWFMGVTGASAAGRATACIILGHISNSGWQGCNTSPYSLGSFATDFIPDYTKNPPSQASIATAAASFSCAGNGTNASPYTACTKPGGSW